VIFNLSPHGDLTIPKSLLEGVTRILRKKQQFTHDEIQARANVDSVKILENAGANII